MCTLGLELTRTAMPHGRTRLWRFPMRPAVTIRDGLVRVPRFASPERDRSALHSSKESVDIPLFGKHRRRFGMECPSDGNRRHQEDPKAQDGLMLEDQR